MCNPLLNPFFLESGYADGVPMLHYSVPVLKAATDDIKVCHCAVISIY